MVQVQAAGLMDFFCEKSLSPCVFAAKTAKMRPKGAVRQRSMEGVWL